jgi:hypothetical protein
MDELLFNAMDIPNEAKKILDEKSDAICKGMTEQERKAYDFGVETVLNLTRQLLETDEDIAVHISGFDHMEEMDIAELEETFLK